jgi:hypothetical protein
VSIKILDTFSTSLPKNKSYREQISALPGLEHWWVAGEQQNVSGGYLVSWSNLSGASPAYAGTGGKAPSVSSSGINGQTGYVFDGVDDFVTFSLTGADFDTPYSLVSIFKAPVPAVDGYLLSTFSGIQTGTWITLGDDENIEINHGNGTSALPFSADAPSIIIMGYSYYYLSGRYNGEDFARVSATNAYGSQSLVAGDLNNLGPAPTSLTLCEVMKFGRDITNDAETINLLESYASDPLMYGVALAV